MLKWLKTKRELLKKIDQLEAEKDYLESRLNALMTDVKQGMDDPKRLYLTWLIILLRHKAYCSELTWEDLSYLRLFAYGNDQACETDEQRSA